MKDSWIDSKGERMLELLAQGAPSRVIARQMGYQEGTMRVYLHKLYKHLGVANKTEAVIWYLSRGKAAQPPQPLRPIRASGNNDLIGEMALQEDLHTALGVMGEFIGPYGRVWEVAARLNGEAIDARTQERREAARRLWRALLAGDWAYGKRLYDADNGAQLVVESPSDAVMLAALLVIGGFTSAAESLASRLAQKRRGASSASARELGMLNDLRSAVEGDADALVGLYTLASERAGGRGLKQSAMALLFHAYRLRKDAARARQTANALWAEAETARRELEAMGDRPISVDALIPMPDRAVARHLAAREREKVGASR